MSLRRGWWTRARWVAATGALVLAGVGAAGLLPASAAPLPATYTGSAVGDVLTLESTLLGATLATTDLVHSVATVDSASPGVSAMATSANFGLRVGPVVAQSSTTETAPPSHTASGSFAAVGVPGVLSTGLLSWTDSVRWDGATSCAPLGVPLSSSVTQTAGASLDLLGIGIVDTGVASVNTSTGLVALSPTHDTRGIAATTQGSMAGLSLLNGTVTVSALQPSLTTTATDGVATSANLSGSAVTVTGPAGTVSLAAGATVNITVPLVGSVSLRLASNADVTGSFGRFSTTYLTATVSLLGGTGTVTLGILPITVQAAAPAGGVECDTTAPVVAITAPADGSTTTDTTPAVTGTSDVLSGTVSLVIDGAAPVTVPTDGSGAWSYTPPTPLTEGPHAAQVTATDAADNSSSDSVTFVVDLVPAVDITAPPDGSTTNDSTPTVSGTSTTSGGTLLLVVDGGGLLSVTAAPDGTWSWTPPDPLAGGPHTVVVTASDAEGNSVSDSVTFTVDTAAPAIAISTPADGSSTSDNTPAVTGTSDVLSGSISLVIDGGAPVTVPTDATGAWTYPPPAALTDGPHTVVATATDAAGNTTTDNASFTVDTTAPVIAITTPADGSTTTDSTPAITGTSDVLSGSIELVIDGAAPVTVPTDATGAWSYTPPALADGPHSVVATATDAAGNSTSDTVAFTVAAVAPADVTITSPADGSTTTHTTPRVSGTTRPSTTVRVSIDGAPPVDIRANGSGIWTFEPDRLSCGQHTVTATAGSGDEANTASSTFTVLCESAADDLPRTGSDPLGLVSLGSLLLAGGALALAGARRRPLRD